MNNDAANKSTYDSDGWLRTGDLGYFDENGVLFLIDRKKDMFKHANHQISPIELEMFIEQNIDVAAVCVVGIPDDATETLPAAVVIRNDVNNQISENDIFNLIAGKF